MEGEVHNTILDWTIALASLLYCHGVGMFIPKGICRFFALFPVICLFIFLPLNLHTMFLCGLTSFFLTWLGNFKLLLYAFGQGPLSSYPPLSLSHFVFTACLPIKILRNQEKPSYQVTKKMKFPQDYVPRVLLFIVAVKAPGYEDRLHPLLTTAAYAYILFFMLSLLLALTASLARSVVGVELEPQFDEPHHATSVQNFWGKRWNLMVSSILRPTVYHPARAIFSYVVPQRWVSVPAVFATFLVSGIVHELIFYHLGRLKPTWEFTSFFVIQGVCVAIEIVIKKTMGKRVEPPPAVARVLTLSFVMLTAFWLFFPPFLKIDPYGRSCREVMAFLGFLTSGQLVSPNDSACPL